MKHKLTLLIMSILITAGYSQTVFSPDEPVIQVQKKITTKNTLGGNKISFYIGKFVDTNGVSKYVRFKYEILNPNFPPEVFQGYIYDNEFEKLINAVPNLTKKLTFAEQYPSQYTVSFFYIFDDGTRIGFTKSLNKKINWYIQLNGIIVPIKNPEILDKILKQCVQEAKRL